jgi:nitrogen-specific signal transduction histidine kinase
MSDLSNCCRYSMIYSFAAAGLAVFAANLLIALFIFFKKPTAKINRLFSLFFASVSIYGFGFFRQALSATPAEEMVSIKILLFGTILIPIFFVHATYAILNKKIYRPILYLIYLLGVIFELLNIFTDLFASNPIPKFGLRYLFQAGPLYPVLALGFAIGITVSIWQLIVAYRTSAGLERNRNRYLFLGMAVGFMGGSAGFLLGYNINLFPINPFSTYCVVLGNLLIGYSIVKYRLLDINVILTRAGVFTVVYTFVLGIPFGLAGWGRAWLTSLFGQEWFWLPMLLLLGFATAGPFLYTYFRRHAEDVILKNQRRYQRALVELSKSMGRIREIDKLYKTIVFTVVDTIKVPFAGIYLKDEEYNSYQLKQFFPKKSQSRFQEFVPLDHPLISLLIKQKRPFLSEEIGVFDKIDLDHGLIIPCFVEEDLLGFLVIGPKPNNQMYTPDDVLIFETLSYSTALAIENCKFWKDIENRQRKARLQEMDSFAYSLAHEIDNPMTVLLNMPNFLRKHFLKYISDPQEQKEVDDTCKHMTQLAERVSGMVKAIRKFGEPTTGELAPLNLQEVIDGYSKLYAPEIKAQSIYFEKEMPNEPIYVNGVAAELQQVLIIFANNAIHAMKYADPKKITLKLTRANHNIARIAFSDTGYGIKPEKIETIFAPFVTSKASTEGTGMGLYNAKGLVLRHKGKIWAESEGHSKGATFIVELPIIEDIKPEDLTKKDEPKWKF